jgi:TP901 family phage tail tape measure protein
MATQVGSAYVEIGAKINGLERGLKDANRQFEAFAQGADKNAAQVGAKFQALGQRMTSVGRKMTLGLTLPIVGIGTAAFKMAADFERSMSKITGLVGISRTEVAKMRGDVLKLSKGTGKSASELADGLFVITSAGLRGSEAMDALDASAKAGAAGLGQTNDIARSVAGAMNAYGSSVLDAGKATDIIVATARAGNFETSQLAGALGRVLPFAKQAGASLEQVGGAVALLTRTNGNAAESITQMTALFRAFVVPTEEGKKALSAIGLSAKDVRDSIAKDGLAASLQMLDKRLGGNREQLGRLLGSSEAAGAAFQILDADAQTLNDTFGVTAKSAGMTEDAFGAAADTAQFKMQQAMSALQSSLIEIGAVIAPVVAKIAEGVSRIVGAFSSLPGPVKTAAVAFAGLVAAMGPLLWMGGKVIGSIAAIKIAMAGMGAASAGTAAMGVAAGGAAGKVGMLGAALPMLANPIGLVVAGVGLGVAALFAFRNEMSASDRFMQGMSESTKAHADIVRQVNTDYRNQITAVSELNTSNAAASAAREKHTTAVQAYNSAVSAGRKAGETEVAFLQRLNGLRIAAAQANVGATTATNQNTDAVRKAVDGSGKLLSGIQNESKAAQDRVTKAQAQVDAAKRFGMSQEATAKATGELASAQANAGLVEARRTDRLKEVRKQQIATRDAIKSSVMGDEEKAKSLDIVNRNISRTSTELKNVQATPDPKKKIDVDTVKANRDVDNIDTKLNNLDGKTVNPFVNVIERITKAAGTGKYRGGYVTGFAGGGKVRGPGGRDRVPAMLTAGEVVLTKRQQSMVDGGMNIRDAIMRTGGAFNKGGFVKPKQNKGEDPKAYRRRVARARAQWRQAQLAKTEPSFNRAIEAFKTGTLSNFDQDTQTRLKAAAATSATQMANIERTFRGGVVNVGGSWQRITGSVETHEKDVAESLKKVEDRYKGLFKSLDKQMRAAQKQMSAQFDALTPAEQQIKNMQDAASASDLQGALSAAQAELAEATKYGDTAGIAEAQKKMREAERNIMLAELAKTAEAERAQRETEREAAQDAFNEEWEGKREALQTALDGELTQIREQGELKRMILDAQMAEQQAQEQAALEASQASLEAQRAGERVALQHQLEDQAAAFMRKRNMFIGNHATIVGLMNRFARKMEISGVKIGAALAKGLDDAGKVVKGKAAGLAKIIEDYLKTASPTKLGPMSSLDTWWSGLAPALVDGIDTGALEGGIAAAASLEGAVALSGSRMSAAAAGSVINLTVTDNTLAGMSREQADRVASQIKASLDRQIRIGI